MKILLLICCLLFGCASVEYRPYYKITTVNDAKANVWYCDYYSYNHISKKIRIVFDNKRHHETEVLENADQYVAERWNKPVPASTPEKLDVK